ncbi:hypothetical protein O4J56_06840 [Nocardiopsis sp. RSe5-2]|uniref:Uncharacterized protein n=1 Tax=Nocardiopsis endophytica TaxID=3018445 RepID=A0ABT4U0Z3_9ACTN|nr:hypothetical protein [Nocardiopsis endophytica]MDA2810351.1 hypothetical protein [Nocardiopsis endophytica]
MTAVFVILGLLAAAGVVRYLVGPHVLVQHVRRPETDTDNER